MSATRDIWCLLEPCQGRRYRHLTSEALIAPRTGLENFSGTGAFRTHLAEEHDFDVDRCLNLMKRETNHFDGPTRFWLQAIILDGAEPIGYLDEEFERDPEDAAAWAAAMEEIDGKAGG